MRTLAICLGALSLLVTGCGGTDPAERACELLGEEEVVAALRGAGVEEIVLRRRSTESLDQSICAYRGGGVNVRLNVDSAPEVRRRYFNRVTEALHLSSNDPANRPQPVKGLGDEDALGPAGAYWIDDYRQLFVLRGERQFIYQLSAPRLAARSARVAATRLARATLPGTPRAGEEGSSGGDGFLVLELGAPEDGDRVRSSRVVVRGAVNRDDAEVRIGDRQVVVQDGIFAQRVALRPGRNRIRVTAVAGGGPPLAHTVIVHRGRPPRAVGEAFARRQPGVVPDLLAEPLGEAQAILAGAGLAHRVVKLVDGSLRTGRWSVCRQRPFPGDRVRGRVTLFVDREDLFRTSGTACAQE